MEYNAYMVDISGNQLFHLSDTLAPVQTIHPAVYNKAIDPFVLV